MVSPTASHLPEQAATGVIVPARRLKKGRTRYLRNMQRMPTFRNLYRRFPGLQHDLAR
ncbi:hypothetical protein [Tahibacter harae]|uniref:Uncharacterized protein n=1 Tax=Tahibacter harae TaxID=2963937 RepID=A0ABT1QT48_9GAMM|nr:hypothetical protein [Tahibacter harae]MCQ4165444.1 hypothetical protein [Tahibacter harae]